MYITRLKLGLAHKAYTKYTHIYVCFIANTV